ncbi:alpha/beta hydrolase fold domain-containing protein [Intrasporangium sp. DVR]|uniref:alpha/beta hydrolase n=1 Tax=Intrasporangium sp. DVR TaxID=3127867 RepID=UPI00313A6F69
MTRPQPPAWLHPQVRALPDTTAPIDPRRLDEQRRLVADNTPAEAGPGVPVHHVADVDADGVPGRLYRPAEGRLPVVVYVHGGGWVDGGLASHDPLCRLLAARSGAAVLSVDYRLAPENPWPAASDDVDRAIDWVGSAAAAEHSLDGGRLALSGDSSGGHLAAVAARRCRDRGIAVRAQALFYPVIDPTGATWGETVNPGLKAPNMRWCWDVFVPPGVDRTHPDISPALGDLRGLPPTLVVTAEHDILTPEAESYAAALAEAGVSSVAFRAQGLVHGFVRRLARFDAAAAAVDVAAGHLARHLGG